MIPSPERLQETQLGASGVPSRGLIYWYNATNVRKCDDSYDRVVHRNKATNASSWLSCYVIHYITLRHLESYLYTTDITAPRPPVWPHSYVSVDHAASRRYGRCHKWKARKKKLFGHVRYDYIMPHCLLYAFWPYATIMPRHSQDLKACIPILFYKQHFTVKEICKILGIQKTLVYSSLMCFWTYGIAHNPHTLRRTGRQRLLSSTDIKFIASLVGRRHTIYLNEIQTELYEHREISISVPTLCRTLQHLALTRKVVSAHALEQDDLCCSAFMNLIADEVPDSRMIMFIDEAARNWRTSQWSRGWALYGKECIQRWVFVHGEHYSILPIVTLDGIITYDIIPRPVSSKHFIQFLHELVVSVATNPAQWHHWG